MPDYSKGKIYCIRSHQTDDIYIGSTIQELGTRMARHRGDYKLYQNNEKGFCTSFYILDYEDAYIELIKNYPCNDKYELKREEGKHQREMECVNKKIEGRTRKEYREDNKEQIAKKQKEWNEKNKEHMQEWYKQYAIDNKEHIQEYKKEYYSRPEVKERVKEYRKEYSSRPEVKERVKERQREYYSRPEVKERRKEYRLRPEVKERQKEQAKKRRQNNKKEYKCDCGSIIMDKRIKRHEQTQKHIKYVQSLN